MQLTADEIAARLRVLTPDAGTEVGPESRPRCAAVLVPLLWWSLEWHLLLTRRTTRVESHKGQVSFPGGACDPGESTPEITALREAKEELGIRRENVRVLGRIAPLLTVSNYRVTPVVGIIPWPYVFRIENAEVDRVFTIPLVWLSEPANRWEFHLPVSADTVCFFRPYDGELLWGVSASITTQLIDILGRPLS